MDPANGREARRELALDVEQGADILLVKPAMPQLDQVALGRLIETGRFDRHLRRVRDSYRQRRDALVSAVAETMGGGTIAGLDAGHHVLLRLPAGVDEERVVADARAAGIAVRGLSDDRVTPDDEALRDPLAPALVIGFGNVTTRQIREGIAVLGELVQAAHSLPLASRDASHRRIDP
jgi:GntR family transcriptional regulator/MocR family aminotransferase